MRSGEEDRDLAARASLGLWAGSLLCCLGFCYELSYKTLEAPN